MGGDLRDESSRNGRRNAESMSNASKECSFECSIEVEGDNRQIRRLSLEIRLIPEQKEPVQEIAIPILAPSGRRVQAGSLRPQKNVCNRRLSEVEELFLSHFKKRIDRVRPRVQQRMSEPKDCGFVVTQPLQARDHELLRGHLSG